MADLISYDGVTLFPDQADPLVSKTTEYIQEGERWGTVERINLNGVITGSSLGDIYAYQTGIIDSLGEDFKTLAVDGFGDFEGCTVGNISFNESDYLSNASYSIDIESYGEEGLLALYGVINPRNSISYDENEDMTISATRSISAKGVSTAAKPNAINNAKAFVSGYAGGVPEGEWGIIQNRSGEATPNSANWVMKPFFAGADYVNASAPMLLLDRSESFNRITAEVSLTENYVIDTTGKTNYNADYILRYTEDLDRAEGSQERVSIRGSVEGSKYSLGGMSGAFAYYKTLKDELGEIIFNESLTQDAKNNSLDFSFEYQKGYNIDIIPKVSVSINEGSDGSLISVSVNGSVSAKNPVASTGGVSSEICDQPPAAAAYPRVLRYFNDNTFEVGESKTSLWYDHAQKAYEDYKGPEGARLHPSVTDDAGSDGEKLDVELKLNPQPLSSSITHNKEDGSISCSYSFDDRFTAVGLGYESAATPAASRRLSADLSISAKPMVEAISVIEGTEQYIFFDQGYHSLAELSIGVNIVGRPYSEGDMSIGAIAKQFSYPLGAALFTGITNQGGLVSSSENKAYGANSSQLPVQSYSESWQFKNIEKLTDHIDNGGDGGYYKAGTSQLYL